MSRQDFLRGGAAASALIASGLGGFSARHAWERAGLTIPTDNRSSWVLLHLAGGVDWHDVIVPLEDSNYAKLRPTLARNSSECIKLRGNIYLNSLLAPLNRLHSDGKLIFSDRMAASTSTHFGAEIDLGKFVDGTIYDRERGVGAAAPLRRDIYYNTLHLPLPMESWETFRSGSTRRMQSAGESLQGNLQEIANSLGRNDSPSIYYVRVGGFDTHYGQRLCYETLFPQMAIALVSFQQTLVDRGLAKRIMTLGFSEFGRGLAENHQGGTEHSEKGKLFFLGEPCSLQSTD